MEMKNMSDVKMDDIMGYLLKDIDIDDIKDFKRSTPQSIANRLKKDCDVIQIKMCDALKNDNIGTYNNLQKALVNNINAIDKLKKDYTLMYSEYTTTTVDANGNTKKQVAIWEQNSDGEIRNHKVWTVVDENQYELSTHRMSETIITD